MKSIKLKDVKKGDRLFEHDSLGNSYLTALEDAHYENNEQGKGYFCKVLVDGDKEPMEFFDSGYWLNLYKVS